MASISTDPNGNRTIQFVASDKRRRSIRCGKIDMKSARELAGRIDELNVAKIVGQPIGRDLAQWLASIGDALHDKLQAVGLIDNDGGGTITNVPVDSPIETMFGQSSGALTVKTLSDSQRAIISECNDVMKMLLEKNKAYGDSAINPVRLFSKAGAVEQINVRIDDKLSRLMRGEAAGEDVELDLIGYLVLKRVARKAVK